LERKDLAKKLEDLKKSNLFEKNIEIGGKRGFLIRKKNLFLFQKPIEYFYMEIPSEMPLPREVDGVLGSVKERLLGGNWIGRRTVHVGFVKHVLVFEKSDFLWQKRHVAKVGFTDADFLIIQLSIERDLIKGEVLRVFFGPPLHFEAVCFSFFPCCD
jgi:hypothetical protein